MNALDVQELARISGAMLSAIEQARAMAQAGQFGPELADLVQHIREMHELAVEQLSRAGDDGTGEYARGAAAALGDAVARVEALLRPDTRTH